MNAVYGNNNGLFRESYETFSFSFGATAPIWTLAYLRETLRFISVLLDFRHSVGILGLVISSL
jgi:hypothetical protein